MSSASRVELSTYADPLTAVRATLHEADEILLGVAFVKHAGVNLLERQLRSVASGRLITTTVFGSTTQQGLDAARGFGIRVRVLNHPQGTFHPKLYLARHGGQISAAVGSANLTSGLIANVEAVAVLRGDASVPDLAALWDQAERWWEDAQAGESTGQPASAPAEQLDSRLLDQITVAITVGEDVVTLSDGKPNRIREITPDGIWVETDASRAKGTPAQLVPAWMIQIAFDYLSTHGELTNHHLLAADGLNVKRSSFVCALLARLPGVGVVSRRPIVLMFTR